MGRTKTYTTKDILKLELAEQLGYKDKIRLHGWGELTSVESGRLGGMVTGYMKKHHWV
ncbi:MAG: small, acid-soluble spore protein, alpha/beta type [Peptococcaceae bacterium]|nr:small, acid-soluble spore protein, alpha/beta type [Peptococcaceae bacterium]MBQ2993901.1 small, acid-soluble spore protein, alpha/beta type [Peptococcaceae bacterium]